MAVVSMAHPRIWITPASLPVLRARAAAKDPKWVLVQQSADRPVDWGIGIITYSLAWLMTGNAAYAAKAWDLTSTLMSRGLGQITPDSGYEVRNELPQFAVAYDWLQDWMSAAQKAQLQAAIELSSDWVWPETNPTRLHQWGVDPDMVGNNYHQSFMFTWMSGLTLAGVSAKAQGYLDNARRRWDAETVPYLNTMAKGGLFLEGKYGVASTGYILWYLLAHQSATGEDLIQSTPWCKEMVSAMLQFTTPGMQSFAPFGDLACEGGLDDYYRRIMSCMSGHDARCMPWLSSVTPNANTQQLTRFEEFCFQVVP